MLVRFTEFRGNFILAGRSPDRCFNIPKCRDINRGQEAVVYLGADHNGFFMRGRSCCL